jgi:hypothetical protein
MSSWQMSNSTNTLNNGVKQNNIDITNNQMLNIRDIIIRQDVMRENLLRENLLREKQLRDVTKSEKKKCNKKMVNCFMDKDVVCITTFNKRLYDDYAHRFISTYNLPFDLVIYSEDDLSFLKDKVEYKIDIVKSHEATPELQTFIDRNKLRDVKDSERGFQYQGIRFSYKVFAVTHLGLTNKYKYLIWIDADMIFEESFNINILEDKMINRNSMMSYLKRVGRYSECGFLVFNMSHSKILDYFREMKRMYTSNDIYKEQEWHDSYIWDLVRIKFERTYNIENFPLVGTNPLTNNINPRIFLYKYIRHLKGNRKYKYKSL